MSSVLLTPDDNPSELDVAVSLFTRHGTSEFIGSLHSRSIRVPTLLNLKIDVLAQHSGLSANKVIVQLLEVAVEEITKALPDEDRENIYNKINQLVGALPRGDDGMIAFPGAQKGEL